MKKNIIFTGIIVILAYCFSIESGADIVYLEKGRKIEGIVKKEDADTVEIETGFGTITIGRAEIKIIEKSAPEETAALEKEWEKKRRRLEAQGERFEKEREKRFKDYYETDLQEAREKRSGEKPQPGEVQAVQGPDSKGIMVETLLNGKAKAMLILDTGASVMVLTKKIGEELGIDLSDRKTNILEIELVGNRRMEAKAVILESVSIQGIEERGVKAVIMLDDAQNLSFKDGLLGMSFLSRFNVRIDRRTMKLTFERIPG